MNTNRPHAFVGDGYGTCRQCQLPVTNARHDEALIPVTEDRTEPTRSGVWLADQPAA